MVQFAVPVNVNYPAEVLIYSLATVRIQGGGTSTGNFTLLGGTLDVNGGTYTMKAPAQLSGVCEQLNLH